MIDKEKIQRINELSKKSKAEGLTDEEKREQKALRDEYIRSVRENLRSQLDTIKVVDPNEIGTFNPQAQEKLEDQSQKLKDEIKSQNANDERLAVTLRGNPANPIGEDGLKMLERMNESHKPLVDWALDGLVIKVPKTILDIGCGGGATIANLNRRFPLATIYGIDISPVAIEKSIEENKELVLEDKVRITEGSVLDLPYGSGFFDLVVSVESYFFWEDFKKALEQIYRVLNRGGTVMLIAEAYKGKMNPITEYLQDELNLRLLSPDELRAFFTEVGFKDIFVQTKEDQSWMYIKAQK